MDIDKLRLPLKERVLKELANLGVEVTRGNSKIDPEDIVLSKTGSDSTYDIHTKYPEETLNVEINVGLMARTKSVDIQPDEEGVLIRLGLGGKMWYKVHYRSEIREKISKIMRQTETDIRNAYYTATHPDV
jgi:hypothetical protein